MVKAGGIVKGRVLACLVPGLDSNLQQYEKWFKSLEITVCMYGLVFST